MIAIVLAAASVSGPQCSGVPLKQMIADYAELTRKQDAPAIAHLFGTDGVVDNPGAKPIRGETAIDALLSGFEDFVVTSETMTVEKMDQARQSVARHRPLPPDGPHARGQGL